MRHKPEQRIKAVQKANKRPCETRPNRKANARCSHLTQELQSQLDALAAHGIPREKIFAEKISTRASAMSGIEASPTWATRTAHEHCVRVRGRWIHHLQGDRGLQRTGVLVLVRPRTARIPVL